jgi:hypothetical protein
METNARKCSKKTLSALDQVTRFLGGAFHKIGSSRCRGGRLVALEGKNGKKAFAHFRTIWQKGKPVGARMVGWSPC